jgi:hypothetical protein
MPHLGSGELLIIILIGFIKFAVPIAFAIWVIFAYKRIRSNQEAVQSRLDAIERRVSQSGDRQEFGTAKN